MAENSRLPFQPHQQQQCLLMKSPAKITNSTFHYVISLIFIYCIFSKHKNCPNLLGSFFDLAFIAAAVAAPLLDLRRVLPRTSELWGWEWHWSEEGARIFALGCGNAFLIGNAVIRRLNDDLRRMNYSYNGENSNVNCNLRSLVAYNDRLAEELLNTLRNINEICACACARTGAIGDLGA